MGGPKTHYYFSLTMDINKDIPDAEKKMITKYFTSALEASQYLGIGRGTIFNALKNNGIIKCRPDYVVSRCEPPIQKYMKVLIPAYQYEQNVSHAAAETN